MTNSRKNFVINKIFMDFLTSKGVAVDVFNSNIQNNGFSMVEEQQLPNIDLVRHGLNIVSYSFSWENTAEGEIFWLDISVCWHTSEQFARAEYIYDTPGEEYILFQDKGKVYGQTNIKYA